MYLLGTDTEDTTAYFGSGWNGLLIVQDLDRATPTVSAQADEPITIIQASNLDEDLTQVLASMLE